MDAQVKKKKAPNIVFVLSDDHGAWALGCAGNHEVTTPNIDRIAQQGVRFENFFCTSPVCSPARASLLTGTIPSAHGVLDWIRSGNIDAEKYAEQGKEDPYDGYIHEDKPIRYLEGMTTYTDVLAQNGYNCALSGKWHLGDSVSPQHGFRYWYTIGRGGCWYYHPDIVENGSITVRHGEYVTDLITQRAIEFLDEMNQEEKPFYLSVHYTAPHAPWGPEHHPDEFLALYENCPFDSTPNVPDHPDSICDPVYGTEKRNVNLKGYYAAITAMDSGIGKIVERLEQLGLQDDTLLVFAGDNGMNMGHHGIWGKGNGTFPLNMYDTSVKVPFLISWPGMIPKGLVCSQMVSAYDWFPTLLDLLGLDMACTATLPGESFAPLLRGNLQNDSRSVVIYDEYGPARMIRTNTHKYVCRYPYGPDELYDLKQDPDEEHNQIDDPQAQPLVLELRRTMELWFARYADPTIDGAKSAVVGAGQLCSAGVRAEKVKRFAKSHAEG